MAAVKPSELTVTEKLKALFQYQSIDKKIDEIHKLRGELPLEIKDYEDHILGLKSRVDKLVTEINDSKDEISDMENKIKEAGSLKKKYNKQINNVKNNREYDALTKEIENQDLDMQLFEKKINEKTANIGSQEEYLKESKKAVKVVEKNLKEKQKELEVISKETEKEEQTLLKKQTKARKSIEDRLFKAYNKIRTTYKNGLAVVTVQRDSCGGCFAKIPPQRQLEMKQRKKIILCEHCGRVLVDDEIDK